MAETGHRALSALPKNTTMPHRNGFVFDRSTWTQIIGGVLYFNLYFCQDLDFFGSEKAEEVRSACHPQHNVAGILFPHAPNLVQELW